MAKFKMGELIGVEPITARLGAGSGAANNLTDKEVGKIVSLAGESRYNLAAVDAPIEGFIVAVESATSDGFTIGSVQTNQRKVVTFETAVVIGDYVVAGTPVAKDTPLTAPPKVKKAASQAASHFNWRVVSLGAAETGAANTTGLIERVNA